MKWLKQHISVTDHTNTTVYIQTVFSLRGACELIWHFELCVGGKQKTEKRWELLLRCTVRVLTCAAATTTSQPTKVLQRWKSKCLATERGSAPLGVGVQRKSTPSQCKQTHGTNTTVAWRQKTNCYRWTGSALNVARSVAFTCEYLQCDS